MKVKVCFAFLGSPGVLRLGFMPRKHIVVGAFQVLAVGSNRLMRRQLEHIGDCERNAVRRGLKPPDISPLIRAATKKV